MSKRRGKERTERRSRRDFLKTSTTAVSAAVAGGLALRRSAHAAGDDTIKIGLIGCGGRGSGAAVNALNADPNAKLVAMADVFEDKVTTSRDRLKKIDPERVAVDDDHCFAGLDAGQKVIDSEADVILVACASRFHSTYTKAAVDANKHVFVEKPHAIDPGGVRTVMDACEQATTKGLSVVSGLCWRYHTGVQETIQRVLDGAIGDVVAIQETYMRAPYRLIARRPEWSELEYQFRNWYHFNWLSGDDIGQSLLHSMDKAQWVLHEETPATAFGVGGRSSSFGNVYGDVFDHCAITYEYANGVRMYGTVRAQKSCYGEVSDTILGTKGTCNVLKHRIQGETEWRYEGPKCNMYDLEHVALFRSIREGKPINNGIYMANSTMVAVLGQIACYTGRKVTWDEAMKMTYTFGPDQCSLEMDPPVVPDEDGVYPVAIPGFCDLT